MIPIDPNEKIPVIVDNVTYWIKPLTGETGNTWYFKYKEYRKIIDSQEKTDTSEARVIELTNDLFNLLVTGWESSSVKLPKYPDDNKPSKMFNHFDLTNLLWDKLYLTARGLSVEEKKS